MGPTVEYANERPADPIELRIYAGANGRFTLYEDAGDNYDYEKGAFSTIQMEWNDSKQTLNIGARKGSFPGMLKQRRFNVILVCEGHGTESDETHEATLIRYTGKAVEVKMRKGGGWH
jgi:alpha-D-xyloside xylohydrolase